MSPTLSSRSTAAVGIESGVFDIAMNIASLLGNSMVCLAVYRNPRICVTTHLYIVALAVNDLLCAVGSMPFTVTTLVTGKWFFGKTVCEIQAFIMYFVLNISPSTTGLAALNRYMRIIKTNNYTVQYFPNGVLSCYWLVCGSHLLPISYSSGQLAG